MATVVKSKKDEPASSVIRRFKKTVAAAKILQTVKDKEFYQKPSQVKKEKKKEQERNRRRDRRKNY